jgi:sugar phosphate isomerase/epimerase
MSSSHSGYPPLEALNLSGRFPFRLGTTSYIIPADMITNVERLSLLVDDIELLFFEAESDLPDADAVARLAVLASNSHLSYTIHLPLTCPLGAADSRVREQAVRACRRIVSLTAPLAPFAYVLHLSGEPSDFKQERAIVEWQRRVTASLEALLSDGLAPRAVSIENLDYPFSIAAPVVAHLGLSLCMDVGHLLKRGDSLIAHLDRYLPETRVVHLHGVHQGRDHRDLSMLSTDVLYSLYEYLTKHSDDMRVLTLEVFNQPDLIASLCVMEALLK